MASKAALEAILARHAEDAELGGRLMADRTRKHRPVESGPRRRGGRLFWTHAWRPALADAGARHAEDVELGKRLMAGRARK